MSSSKPHAHRPSPRPDASLTERIERQGRRVHVTMGAVCNNNCLFCMERDSQGPHAKNTSARQQAKGGPDGLTPDMLRRLLPSLAGAQEVCFTNGEPTLHPSLFELVRIARGTGIPRVSVMTNGRRLAYRPYLLGLVKAGIDRLYVSVHGHNARLHDSLTRTPGSFEQTWQGLVNATRLSSRIEVQTSTVVVTRNLPYLSDIYNKLSSIGVAHVVFNALQLSGRAAVHFDRLMPSYRQMRDVFEQLIDESPDNARRAYLVDVPPCVTEGLPDARRGYLEERALVGINGYEGEQVQPDLFQGESSHEVQAWMRVYGPGCTGCRYRGICDGVYERYVQAHGWDEFVPVT